MYQIIGAPPNSPVECGGKVERGEASYSPMSRSQAFRETAHLDFLNLFPSPLKRDKIAGVGWS